MRNQALAGHDAVASLVGHRKSSFLPNCPPTRRTVRCTCRPIAALTAITSNPACRRRHPILPSLPREWTAIAPRCLKTHVVRPSSKSLGTQLAGQGHVHSSPPDKAWIDRPRLVAPRQRHPLLGLLMQMLLRSRRPPRAQAQSLPAGRYLHSAQQACSSLPMA